MIDLNRVKLQIQSWYDSTEYDTLIEVLIQETEAYVNELISWQHVPNETTFKETHQIQPDNTVYLEKLPVSSIQSIERNGEEITNYEINNYTGRIQLCDIYCNDLNVLVEYVVGGKVSDYPTAINKLILELVVTNLNYAINNAYGFNSQTIGSDIKLDFNYELTQQQMDVIKAYQ